MSKPTPQAENGTLPVTGVDHHGLAAGHPPHQAMDPVCGMEVDPATAPSAEHNGETFYFCSEGCRTTFLGQQSPTPAEGTSA